jgi:hypothetical protein
VNVADTVTIHVAVSYPGPETPAFLSWSGPVPWPSLPRPGDAWVCCPDNVYRTSFESVSFRGPQGTREAVLIKATVPFAQAAHLMETHDFTAAADTE